CFVLLRSSARRRLLSFPTRRSSDLTFIGDGFAAVSIDAHLGLHIHQLSAGGEHDEHHAALVEEVDAVCLGGDSVPHAGGGGAVQDRKSTRLNSSHASISYAVFCLQK